MKTISIGNQDFESIQMNHYFYIDKTNFIKEWWESGDSVTLITRPRRFGKTLNMSMLNCFFSNSYANRGELFSGLSIWENEDYHKLQGTYPVIFLSFAAIKESNMKDAQRKVGMLISELYIKYRFLLDSDCLEDGEREFYQNFLRPDFNHDEVSLSMSLNRLSAFLSRYYGKKVIILLDEYDTPMQEAYVNGYWDDLTLFFRNLFNAAFKTNPYLERGIMTGITRVSKESIFSDLNNLNIVTTTSEAYATSFGFTEEETFNVLDMAGLSDQKDNVKKWYDGFTFGTQADIYNPWSIINFLDKKKLDCYWANSSSNSLIKSFIQSGNVQTKQVMEDLLSGKSLITEIDEQIIFSQLGQKYSAIWSLLLASGYLKVVKMTFDSSTGRRFYELALTNFEVQFMFSQMIRDWFGTSESEYHSFIESLLADDVEAMNYYMNKVALESFSYFDSGRTTSVGNDPERFYHGFVLGLLVELSDRYQLSSNRESGLGRYDIMLIPKDKKDTAIIIEFKVFNPSKEKSLSDTVTLALKQIEDKKYDTELLMTGFSTENIKHYGFAFQGKTVLIG